MKSTLTDRLGIAALVLVAAFSIFLLVAPSLIVIAISFEPRSFIAFPPSGVTLHWYGEVFKNKQLMDALITSLRIAALVTGLCLVLGIPAAFASIRGRFGGKTALNAFLLAPQMMPGMVLGIATLFFGAYIGWRQSDLMLVVSLSVFCLPFVIRMIMARLIALDPALDEASSNLGAGKAETFMRITLPQLAPAAVAAAAFTFIEAFDNVTVALFTSDVRARPLSVELYYLVQFESTPMIAAISALQIGFSLVVLVVLARSIGLDRVGR